MNQLPTCLDINAECDNEPCMFHHDHKCTFHCRQWRHVNTGYQNQSERDAHWRDLFVSDLRSSIKWDAEHGNPELFKVVVTLDKHYNTFSVEQHDKQVRDKVLDEVIAKWREWHHAGYERPIQRETVVKLFEELRQAGSP